MAQLIDSIPPLRSDDDLGACLDTFEREMAQLVDRYPDLATAAEKNEVE